MPANLEVRFYATRSGREPVRDWLRAASGEFRRTLGEDIKTVQFGWPLGMPLVRKLEPSLWEIRSIVAQGIARVLFTVVGDKIVLLHGFVKKSARTPSTDLDTARQRLKEVML